MPFYVNDDGSGFGRIAGARTFRDVAARSRERWQEQQQRAEQQQRMQESRQRLSAWQEQQQPQQPDTPAWYQIPWTDRVQGRPEVTQEMAQQARSILDRRAWDTALAPRPYVAPTWEERNAQYDRTTEQRADTPYLAQRALADRARNMAAISARRDTQDFDLAGSYDRLAQAREQAQQQAQLSAWLPDSITQPGQVPEPDLPVVRPLDQAGYQLPRPDTGAPPIGAAGPVSGNTATVTHPMTMAPPIESVLRGGTVTPQPDFKDTLAAFGWGAGTVRPELMPEWVRPQAADVQQRTEERNARVNDPNYFKWAQGNKQIAQAGADLANQAEWAFTFTQQAAGAVPLPNARPDRTGLPNTTVAQTIYPLLGYLNRAFNPFYGALRRPGAQQTPWELAGPPKPGETPWGYAERALNTGADIQLYGEMERIDKRNVYLASLPPDVRAVQSMEMAADASGIGARAQAGKYINDKRNVDMWYDKATVAMMQGHDDIAARYYSYARFLDTTGYSELIHLNDNPWAIMVEGSIFDVTNLIPIGMAVDALRGLRAANVLSAAPGNIVEAMTIGAAKAAKIAEGQPVTTGGFSWIDNLRVLGRTPDAKAHIDSDVVFGAFARLLSGVETTDQAKLLLAAFLKEPGKLFTGVKAIDPNLAVAAGDAGRIKFGAQAFANQQLLDRSWLIQMVKDKLPDFRSLQDPGYNAVEFFAELDTEIYRAARTRYGLSALDTLPEDAASYRLVKQADGTYTMGYFDKKGKQVHVSAPMAEAEATAYKLALDHAMQGQSKSVLMKGAQALAGAQREILSTMFLALRPGHWIRNAAAATATLIADDLYSIRRTSSIIGDLSRKGLEVPSPRMLEGLYDQGREIGAAAEGMGQKPGQRAAWNIYGKAKDAGNQIWTGAIDVLGVPFGEQSFYVRGYHKAFERTFRNLWQQVARTDVLPRLTALGLTPQQVQPLVDLIIDVGINGSKADVARAVRTAVTQGHAPFSLRSLGIPDELIEPDFNRALTERINAWLGSDNPLDDTNLRSVQQSIRDIFTAARAQPLSTIRQTPPQVGAYTFSNTTAAEDVAETVDTLTDEARRAGIPYRQVQSQMQEFAAHVTGQMQATGDTIVQEIRALPTDNAAQVNIIFDAWARIGDMRDEARRAVDDLSETAVAASQSPNRGSAQAQWERKWTETRRIYDDLAAAEQQVLAEMREDFAKVDAGQQFAPRYDYRNAMDRYLDADMQAIEEARRLEPGAATDPRERQKFQNTIKANRAYTDLSRTNLYGAFARYPSTNALDIVVQTERQSADLGRMAAAHLAPLRDQARRAKTPEAWAAYFAARNATWRELADATHTLHLNASRLIVLTGEADKLASMVRWQANGIEYVLEAPLGGGKWQAYRLSDGARLTVGKGEALPVPADTAKNYYKVAQQVDAETDAVMDEIIAETVNSTPSVQAAPEVNPTPSIQTSVQPPPEPVDEATALQQRIHDPDVPMTEEEFRAAATRRAELDPNAPRTQPLPAGDIDLGMTEIPRAPDVGPPQTKQQRQGLHATGRDLHGDKWPEVRPALALEVSNGRTSSSAMLTGPETDEFIRRMKDELRRRVQVPPAMKSASRESIAGEARTAFKLKPQQVDDYMAVLDARAEQWAEDTGRKAEEYYKSTFVEMKRTKFTTDGKRLSQKRGAEPPRAEVNFLDDGRAIIHAFRNADFSSLLHETVHVFRRDLARVAQVNPKAADDLKRLEKAAGVVNGKWTVEAEEKIAGWGERYFMEGTAPTPQLEGAFGRFKDWLTSIYKRVRAVDRPGQDISPEVRQVFDRLLGKQEAPVSLADEAAVPAPSPAPNVPASPVESPWQPVPLRPVVGTPEPRPTGPSRSPLAPRQRVTVQVAGTPVEGEIVEVKGAQVTVATDNGATVKVQAEQVTPVTPEPSSLPEAAAPVSGKVQPDISTPAEPTEVRRIEGTQFAGELEPGTYNVRQDSKGKWQYRAKDWDGKVHADVATSEKSAINKGKFWAGKGTPPQAAPAPTALAPVEAGPKIESQVFVAHGEGYDVMLQRTDQGTVRVVRYYPGDGRQEVLSERAMRGTLHDFNQWALDTEAGKMPGTTPTRQVKVTVFDVVPDREGNYVASAPIRTEIIDLEARVDAGDASAVDAYAKTRFTEGPPPQTAEMLTEEAPAEQTFSDAALIATIEDGLRRIGKDEQNIAVLEAMKQSDSRDTELAITRRRMQQQRDAVQRAQTELGRRAEAGTPLDTPEGNGSIIEVGEQANALQPTDAGRTNRDDRAPLEEAQPLDAGSVPQQAGVGSSGAPRSGTDTRSLRPDDTGRGKAVGSVGSDEGTVVPAPGGRRAGTGTDGAPAPRPAAVSPTTATPGLTDFRYTDEFSERLESFGSERARYNSNLEAIKTLRKIQAEGRHATPDEQVILAQYSGWGALANTVFNPRHESSYKYGTQAVDAWKDAHDELKALLTPDEWARAARSTLNAHYTSPTVIKGIYAGLDRLGLGRLNHPRVLEPAGGIGSFFGLMPKSLAARSMRHAVEIDPITAGILGELYQNANVILSGFEKAPLPDNYYDLIISNVPFGSFGVTDTGYAASPALRWLQTPIHNYFFAKAMDKARPGGVIAFVTSRYTMDGTGQATRLRQFLSERGDFLGAVRLPNTAFKKNAGTEVVTDIIFLRKRLPDEQPGGQAWGNVAGITAPDSGTDFFINEYYVEHPEMVLGTHSGKGSMYAKEEYTVIGNQAVPLADQIDQAMRNLPEGVLSPAEGEAGIYDVIGNLEKQAEAAKVKRGSYTRNAKTGAIQKRVGDELVDVPLAAPDKARMGAMLDLRQKAHELIDAETKGATDKVLDPMRKALRRDYDAFVKKYKNLNDRANVVLMGDDPEAAFLQALEVPIYKMTTRIDKKTGEEIAVRSTAGYRPADILSRRVIRGNVIPDKVDTASDALTLALRERNRIDLDYMGKLTGKDEGTLLAELGEAVYQDPGGGWVTRDTYLSGDVRLKLRQAQEAAEIDPTLQRNVEALEKVIPADLPPSQIGANLGAGWIPAEDYRDFIASLLGLNNQYVDITYTAKLHQWNIGADTKSYLSNSVKNTATYGTERYPAIDLIDDAMNNRMPVVKDKVSSNPDKYEVNDKETTVAREKMYALRDLFKRWVWADPDRASRLSRVYNDEFNSYVSRRYDGAYLTFPGMTPDIELRSTQKDAIARILQSGNTLLAHEVGAGKTFTMATAAMEMRRLGLAKKPMIVVPNHLYEQWPSEFRKLYPTAKILSPDEKDFAAAGRRALASRIATGDWDAVIIPMTQLEKLPVRNETYASYINAQTRALRNLLDEMGEGGARGSKRSARGKSAKQIEAQIIALEEKLEQRLASTTKDNTVFWEELGVDAIFADEAHAYKNLMFATKMTNLAGLGKGDANRALDMFIKVRQLTKATGGRNVVFATGTPISNSISEVWTMMRYMMHETLEAKGLDHFDAWAAAFGETIQEWMHTPTGWALKDRFNKFNNAVELNHMFQQVTDIIKASEVPGVTLPTMKGGQRIRHTVDPTKYTARIQGDLRYRAEAIKRRHGKAEKGDDIILNLYNDARKGGLDLRLLDPRAPDLPTSKINVLVPEIKRIYDESMGNKGTQFVFCNLGVPGGENYNLYADIKTKLVKLGIPANEIAFMHDAVKSGLKQQMFDAMNDGRVRVLIGSKNMETGVNAQERAIALHHLDSDYRPSDILQREGRIIRQGNTNKEVEIHVYLQQPLDTFMWQLVEKKAGVINSFMSRNLTERVIEDVDEATMDFGMIAGDASGDPLHLRKMELDKQIRDLGMMESAHADQRMTLRRQLSETRSRLNYYTDRALFTQQDIQEQAAYANRPFSLTLGDTTYTDRQAAQEALVKAIAEAHPDAGSMYGTIPGQYKGFGIRIEFYQRRTKGTITLEPANLLLRGRADHEVHLTEMNANVLTRMDEAIANLPTHLDWVRREADRLKKHSEELIAEGDKPFERASELTQTRKELIDVEAKLKLTASPVSESIGKYEHPLYGAPEGSYLLQEAPLPFELRAAQTEGPTTLRQPARRQQGIDWFGLGRTQNAGRDLWAWTRKHWREGVQTPTMGDVGAHQVRSLEDAERTLLDALPTLGKRAPNTLTPTQRQGVLGVLTDTMAPRFDDAIYGAQTTAQKYADGAMLNFKDRRGFDTALGLLFPYHFFWTRSAKNWAKRALRKPALVNMYYEQEKAVQTENRQAGVPMRLKGTVPLWTRSDGSQVRMQNPLHYALPFNMYFPGSIYNNPEDAQSEAERWLMTIRNYTPGLFPLWSWLIDKTMDSLTPLPGGEKRTDSYFVGSYFPQVTIPMMASQALRSGAGTAQWATGPYQPYRVGRQIVLVAKRDGIDPNIAGWAQQIATNVDQGRPLYENVEKGYRDQAYALYIKAKQEAARDRLAQTGVGFGTGTNAYVWRPEEQQMTAVQRQYGAAGYDPQTQPMGSKAAQGAILDANPLLPAWWGKSATLPQGPQPGQPTPGQSATTSMLFGQMEPIYAQMAQAVTDYLTQNPSATGADLNAVKEPFYARLGPLQERLSGLPQRETSVGGMNPSERALFEIEKFLAYEPPNKPAYPGENATPEVLQTYYASKATWEEARLRRVDASLRQLMQEEPSYPEEWRKVLPALLGGRWTANILRADEQQHMGPVERAWNERTTFAQEISAQEWATRKQQVAQLVGPGAVALFEQYLSTPAGPARQALKESNPQFGAAIEAAFNPQQYAQGIAMWGPAWYTIATGAPKHPGDNAGEAQMQRYYTALDAYTQQNPLYEPIRLWYRGRPNAQVATLPEGTFIPNDYGKDYALAISIFGGDIFAVKAARSAAYAQSKETGWAWDDAHQPELKRIKGYGIWYHEQEKVPPQLAAETTTPIPDVNAYQGPRPVGTDLTPLGQPLPPGAPSGILPPTTPATPPAAAPGTPVPPSAQSPATAPPAGAAGPFGLPGASTPPSSQYTPTAPPTGEMVRQFQSGTLYLPFDGEMRQTQGYGENPENYARFNQDGHEGMDWSMPKGTPIFAAGAGTVVTVGDNPNGYGNYIVIEHEDGSQTLYAHLSGVDVEQGQEVTPSDQIGLSGGVKGEPGAGNSTGAHLHLGYRPAGADMANGYNGFTDPEGMFDPRTGTPAQQGNVQWDTVNQYANQDVRYVASQAKRAVWEQRKNDVAQTFGPEAAGLFTQYLDLPEGAARQQFKAQHPELRAVNLYSFNPDVWAKGVAQFGQEAIMAWATAPAYGESPEAQERRKQYFVQHPEAWEFSAWLNGRPTASDEGDYAGDADNWKYNAGQDYRTAQSKFGEDIWTLVKQYRAADSNTRRSLRGQFPQIMPFFDWWYAALGDTQQTAQGIRSAGSYQGSGRNPHYVRHGQSGSGYGGYARTPRIYPTKPREMDRELWYAPDQPQRQWVPEGAGQSDFERRLAAWEPDKLYPARSLFRGK